jgi:cell division protein FtsQ
LAQKRSGGKGEQRTSSTAGTKAASKKKKRPAGAEPAETTRKKTASGGKTAGTQAKKTKKTASKTAGKTTGKAASKKRSTTSASASGKKYAGRTAAKGKTTGKKQERKTKTRKIRKVAPPRERHARRLGRHQLLYSVVAVILIAVSVVVGSVVFFKVDTVEADGFTRYTQEEIASASGVKTGENLFLLDKKEIIENLEQQLPYLKDVSIHWKLPSTVRITGVESQPVAALEVSNGWWYMDETGRLLEFSEDPGTLIQVSGLNLLAPSVGTDLAVDQTYQLKRDSLVALLTAMSDQSLLEDAVSIDMTSTTEIDMQYGERFQVKIGLGSDYDYKMRAMAGMLEQLAESEKGTLDLTMENEWHFIPG